MNKLPFSSIFTGLMNKISNNVMLIIVGSSHIYLDYLDDFKSKDASNSSFQFIIKPPSLFYSMLILLRPTYWTMQSYVIGEWYVKKGDLAEIIHTAVNSSHSKFKSYFNFIKSYKTISYFLKQYLFIRYFTRKVYKHYDLSPDLYQCILDKEMNYTCAFFEGENISLLDAQNNKIRTIIERVLTQNINLNILNIGFGWSSFERYLVRNHLTAHITGLTISESQLHWSIKHNQIHLDDSQNSRIKLILQDYHNHNCLEAYDVVISVGMMEHVGKGNYLSFFSKIYSLLKPGGRCLTHIIVKPEAKIPTNSWIDKYIFPGGYIPSISEVVESIERSEFKIENIFIHAPENYRKTLNEWRNNLYSNKDCFINILTCSGVNYNQAQNIYRRWEIYLASSEICFYEKKKSYQIAHFIVKKC